MLSQPKKKKFLGVLEGWVPRGAVQRVCQQGRGEDPDLAHGPPGTADPCAGNRPVSGQGCHWQLSEQGLDIPLCCRGTQSWPGCWHFDQQDINSRDGKWYVACREVMIWLLSIQVLVRYFSILRNFSLPKRILPQCYHCWIHLHCSFHQISQICRLTEMNMPLAFNLKCSDFSPRPLWFVCCVHVCGLLKEHTSEYSFRRDKSPQKSVAEDKRLMRAQNTLIQDHNSRLVKTTFRNWENSQPSDCFIKSLEYKASWQNCVAINDLWSSCSIYLLHNVLIQNPKQERSAMLIQHKLLNRAVKFAAVKVVKLSVFKKYLWFSIPRPK